jgi:vacuolar protein sorting-associated protein 13A/C
MFEGLLERILLRLIGDYIEGLNRDDLHISVWAGDIKLNRLKLRRGALDSLNLPIDVHDGVIEELHVKVPWSKLASSPVQIFINGIYLLAKPQEQQSSHDADTDVQSTLQRLAEALKKRQLQKYENKILLDSNDDETGASNQQQQQQQQSFSARLLSRVWANIQLIIRDVCIDSLSHSCHSNPASCEYQQD